MTQRTATLKRPTPTFPVSADERDRNAGLASGRVGHDSRGNAVWEWRTEEHKYVRDASTTLVRKLQVPSLALEQTGIVKKVNTPVPGWKPSVPVEGGHPFERRGPIAMKAMPARTAPRRQPSRIVVTSRREPGVLDRLKDWFGGYR